MKWTKESLTLEGVLRQTGCAWVKKEGIRGPPVNQDASGAGLERMDTQYSIDPA